jgi:glycosyltransferase involved in cell wall biosynthesis
MGHSTRPRRLVLYHDAACFGGHEVMTARLANVLAHRHEVHVLCHNNQLRAALDSAVRVEMLPFASAVGALALRKNAHLGDIFGLRRLLSGIRPDFAIISQGGPGLCLRGALASRWAGIPTVSYLPMSFPLRLLGVRGGRFLDWFARLHYRPFDAFITISEEQERHIRWFAGSKPPIYVLNNALDLDHGLSEAPSDEHPANTRQRIGIVARIEYWQKGHEQAIEIAEALVERGHDFRMVMIGDGPDRGRLEALIASKGLQGHVVLEGAIHGTRTIYSLFDILLVPSLYEGVPLVLLEALSREKPVLARLTAGTGVFTSYLPPFFLYRTVSEAVEKLAAPERYIEAFAKEAAGLRSHVTSRHSMEAFEANVEEIISQL